MPCCIFCRTTSEKFTTKEHIIPESLGGGDWAILTPGFFCDRCQNRFGSHIEQQALADYPFALLRVLLGIPTKKKRAPWVKSWEGNLHAGDRPGLIGYEPAPFFKAATEAGTKTGMIFPAFPAKPEFVCRFLLKMALETVAQTSPNEVFSPRYDVARTFALTGQKPGRWWFLLREDLGLLSKLLRREPVTLDPELVSELIDIEPGYEVFHVRFWYLDLFVPLTDEVAPGPGFEEPEYKIFWT